MPDATVPEAISWTLNASATPFVSSEDTARDAEVLETLLMGYPLPPAAPFSQSPPTPDSSSGYTPDEHSIITISPSDPVSFGGLQQLGTKLSQWIETRHNPDELMQLIAVLRATQQDCEAKLSNLVPGTGVSDLRVTAMPDGQSAEFFDPFCVTESLAMLEDGFNAYLHHNAPVDLAPSMVAGTYFGSVTGRLVLRPIDEEAEPAALYQELQLHVRKMSSEDFSKIFRGLQVEQQAVRIRELTVIELDYMETAFLTQQHVLAFLLQQAVEKRVCNHNGFCYASCFNFSLIISFALKQLLSPQMLRIDWTSGQRKPRWMRSRTGATWRLVNSKKRKATLYLPAMKK